MRISDWSSDVCSSDLIVPGAAPLADVLEEGAVALVPAVHRRAPDRVEQGVDVAPGAGAEGDRRVGRAEGGDADLRQGPADLVGADADGVQVATLALVGRPSGGGVALPVLDGAVTLSPGEPQA